MYYFLCNDFSKVDYGKLHLECPYNYFELPNQTDVIVNLQLTKENNFPDIGIIGDKVIMRNNLKKFLEKKIENILFIPIKVNNKNSDLYIVNLNIVIDCIDLEKSVLKMHNRVKSIINGVKKLVLKEELLENQGLFFIKGLEGEFFLSDKMKNDLESFSGFYCKPLDEFKFGLFK